MSSQIEENVENRISQGSRFTSTPQGNIASSSPSLSSIHSEPSTHNYDSLDSGVFHFVKPCSENCCKDLKKFNPKKAGKFWKIYKPKLDGTLYCVILTTRATAEEMIHCLLSGYRDNPKSVIMPILKLFIDVSGYQHLEIRDFYNYEAINAKETVHSLQNELLDADLMEIQSSLFQENNSKNCLRIKTAFYDFLQKLIYLAHHYEILYDGIFSVHIFQFIRYMAFSLMKNLRFTGIVFALKLMSACSDVHYHITGEIGKHMGKLSIPNSETVMKLKRQQSCILKYMDFCFLIFSKNCLIPDKSACHIRMECVKEMIHWIIRTPEYVVLKRDSIHFLIKFLQDESSDVRLNALITCEYLINFDIPSTHIMKIKCLMDTIENRIYDINYTVAARACLLLTEFIKVYPRFLGSDSLKSTIRLLIHKNHSLSTAAAKHVITYLRKNSINDRELLINIAKLSNIHLFKNKISLFIDVFIKVTPELQSWKEFLSLILDDTLALHLRQLLLKILYEVILKLNKNKVNEDIVPNINSHEDICFCIIPNAVKLLEFYEDDESKNYILKIITNIDLSGVHNGFDTSIDEIMKTAKRSVQKSSDVDLIKTGVALISHFCNQSSHIRRRAMNIANNVAQYLYNEFEKCKEFPDNPENVIRINEIMLKVSILFKSFNLTDFFNWRDIFADVNFLSSDAAGNYLICSMHYLIWSMKEIVEGNYSSNELNLDTELSKLSSRCKEYLSKCFEILKINKSTSLPFLGFECICDLVYAYHSYLEGPVKFNFAFKILHIKLEEEQYGFKLYDFFKMRILENIALPLKKRQECFCKLIELLYDGILPAKMFSNMLIIYSKHSDEYFDIFNSMFMQLQKIPEGFVTIILHTLVERFTEIVIRDYEISNFNSDEFRELCTLAKKLSSIRKLSMKNLKDIIAFGFNYVFEGNRNYLFLYLLKYFAQRLPGQDRMEILEKLQQIISESDRHQAAVLYFSKILKGSDHDQTKHEED